MSVALETPLWRSYRSRAPRTAKVIMVGRLVTDAGDHLCRVQNISATGLKFHSLIELNEAEPIAVELRNGHKLTGWAAWSEPPVAGMQFEAETNVEESLSPLFARWGRIRRMLPRAPRFASAAIVLVRAAGRTRPALMLDISLTGAKLKLAGGLVAGQQLALAVPGLPPLAASVRRACEDEVGLAFNTPVSFDELASWLENPGLRY